MVIVVILRLWILTFKSFSLKWQFVLVLRVYSLCVCVVYVCVVYVCVSVVYVCECVVYVCKCVSDSKMWSSEAAQPGLSASRWENYFLFVTKNPQFPQHGHSHFPARGSEEAVADGNCFPEYLSATFNTREAPRSAAVCQPPCPSFPRRKLTSRKCWQISGPQQDENDLNCRMRNEPELNMLPF